jgi:hypothetical protein
MYEYAVIFTITGTKYCILVKEANSQSEAIRAAIDQAIVDNRNFEIVEAVLIV